MSNKAWKKVEKTNEYKNLTQQEKASIKKLKQDIEETGRVEYHNTHAFDCRVVDGVLNRLNLRMCIEEHSYNGRPVGNTVWIGPR